MPVPLMYGRTGLTMTLHERYALDLAVPRSWDEADETLLLKVALRRPIRAPSLNEMARHCRNAVIVTCDRTRGVPSRMTFPLILDELKNGGIDPQNVEVLVATGLHKGETMGDVRERFGGNLGDVAVKIHESDDKAELVDLGYLTSGTPLSLNSLVVESDLVVFEGTVEPHFFAGFTGGSKVILPGVAGTETILQNHSWKNIDDPRARYGILKNPIRAEGNEALGHIKKVFSLNLVLDARRKVVFATSGNPIDSFNRAAEIVSQHSSVHINYQPDLIITTNGGYPLDRNVYQCVKGIAVPEEVLHEGSRIVMVSECLDGVAHKEFFDLTVSGSLSEIYAKMKSSKSTIPDQWQVQVLCRVLQKASVWFVTRPELRSEIEAMHMHYAASVEEALASANISEKDRVLAAPQGPSTILKAG